MTETTIPQAAELNRLRVRVADLEALAQRRLKNIEELVDACGDARSLLSILTGRCEIDDPLLADIKATEQALWNVLFPGAAVPAARVERLRSAGDQGQAKGHAEVKPCAPIFDEEHRSLQELLANNRTQVEIIEKLEAENARLLGLLREVHESAGHWRDARGLPMHLGGPKGKNLSGKPCACWGCRVSALFAGSDTGSDKSAIRQPDSET